jgi:hypothetical protein
VGANALNDMTILQEANDILIQHLGAAKAARFWSIWQSGSGDYVKLREMWFAGQTVDSLYEEIKRFQEQQEGQAKS